MRKSIYTGRSEILRDMLRQMRERAGLTQRELCRRLNKEHSFVSKYELGDRRLDIVEFYAICKACGVNPTDQAAKVIKAFGRLGD